METYTQASYAASKLMTEAYSTSFSMSIRLFATTLRPHIYAIYGLVRIADEIVDTYLGEDRLEVLRALEEQTYRALATGYDTNPIVHAFAQTARRYEITNALIAPFFESMRMDITPQLFNQQRYETYIYGSAEVVGLMCLKVFTDDDTLYTKLVPSARHLGAAYQKVNFLRDIAADSDQLGRWYFPDSSAKTFREATKTAIIKDINKDFAAAQSGLALLPVSSRRAVTLSYTYYTKLLEKITHTSAEELLKKRIRINNVKKTWLLVRATIQRRQTKGTA